MLSYVAAILRLGDVVTLFAGCDSARRGRRAVRASRVEMSWMVACCADGETRTLTGGVLSAVPLPLGYVGLRMPRVVRVVLCSANLT